MNNRISEIIDGYVPDEVRVSILADPILKQRRKDVLKRYHQVQLLEDHQQALVQTRFIWRDEDVSIVLQLFLEIRGAVQQSIASQQLVPDENMRKYVAFLDVAVGACYFYHLLNNGAAFAKALRLHQALRERHLLVDAIKKLETDWNSCCLTKDTVKPWSELVIFLTIMYKHAVSRLPDLAIDSATRLPKTVMRDSEDKIAQYPFCSVSDRATQKLLGFTPLNVCVPLYQLATDVGNKLSLRKSREEAAASSTFKYVYSLLTDNRRYGGSHNPFATLAIDVTKIIADQAVMANVTAPSGFFENMSQEVLQKSQVEAEKNARSIINYNRMLNN